MPSKKKKYNARFPAGRIKKIMQSDEEVGKVAQAVPVIISRTLELFVESLLTKTLKITYSRNAKTLSPSHMKQCIMSESRFDFLRELVKNIPDISVAEESSHDSSPGPATDSTQQPYDYRMPSTSCEGNISPSRNGNLSAKNGIQITATEVSGATLPASSMPTGEQKYAGKHYWDKRRHTGKVPNIHATSSKESSVIQHTSDRTESAPPPKLARMDSAPTGFSDPSKSSTRRLMHQSKSVPCTSKEAIQPQTVVPAPIVDINVCNKPIVKIDYSNLVLPDKDSSSGSSSDHNSMNTYMNPVINIDLSKISTQPSCDLQTVSMSAGSMKSTLELDEDYDNI